MRILYACTIFVCFLFCFSFLQERLRREEEQRRLEEEKRKMEEEKRQKEVRQCPFLITIL